MKVILTIEVPDDFEKGNSEMCNLYVHDWSACAARRDYGDTNCCAENCPLEIQEEPTGKCCVECKDCDFRHKCSYAEKERKND